MLKIGVSLAVSGLGVASAFAILTDPDQLSPPLQQKNEKPKTAVIIGGGILGLSTAFQLNKRGVEVTILEKHSGPAQVASYCNGAVIVPSMAASWASAKLLADNPGELASIRLSWQSLTDSAFYRWCAWFWFNSFWPGRADYNHESQRQLALFSLRCMNAEIEEYGDTLAFDKAAKGTLKLFHNRKDMTSFIESKQAIFWRNEGMPFKELSVEDCLNLEPGIANLNDWNGSSVDGNADLVGGVYCPMDSSGDIHLYSKNLEKLCKEKGVKIEYDSNVTNIALDKDGQIQAIEVNGDKTFSSDVYVLAVGATSGVIARKIGVNLPVYPLKGHMATVQINPDFPPLKTNIYSPKQGLIGVVSDSQVRLSGIVEAVGFDYEIETEKGKSLIGKVEGVMKPNYLLKDKAWFHSCLRPVSCDDVAILGQSKIPNLFINTGQGSKGWSFSWGCSTFLAQIICGENTEIDPKRYTPLRFHPITTFANKYL